MSFCTGERVRLSARSVDCHALESPNLRPPSLRSHGVRVLLPGRVLEHSNLRALGSMPSGLGAG
jgi:hypothetical protein